MRLAEIVIERSRSKRFSSVGPAVSSMVTRLDSGTSWRVVAERT